MTIETRFDEVSSVGHVNLRLHPLDVGFDLRGERMPVAYPPDTTCATYARIDGERWYVEGTPEEVARVLRDAGYIIQRREETKSERRGHEPTR